MTEIEMRRVLKEHMDAEARHDAAAAAATYVEEGYYENVPLGLHFKGRDAVAVQYGGSFSAMPDSRAEIDAEVVEGSRLVHWGTFRATLSGEFIGQPPTGRAVALPFIATIEFADGKMRGERLYYDLATLCEQAGVSLSAVRANAQILSESMRRAA
jgi:steroid delta-isomerase-like uncharacterized protein